MRRLIAVFLLFSLLLCAGCRKEDTPYIPTGDGLAAEEDPSQDFTEPTEAAPEQDLVLVYYPGITMNPFLCTDFTNRALFSLLYQGLFTVDNNYEVSPMLCSRYTVSESMRYYTFYIEDATFSDGTPLTIQDVYASLHYAKGCRFYKGRFLHVLDIVLTEDGGIKFQLDAPYENFPILLDIPIVKATDLEATWPIGSGPYYLENTTAGTRLRKNTNWWCDPEIAVNATSIPLVEATDVNQIRDSFEFGDVGLVCANPGAESYADYRCDYELWDCENGIFLYLACNTQYGIFSKPNVRAALTYAIDRDALVSKYYREFAHSATLAASPLSPYYNKKLAENYQYNPERFVKAISESYLTGSTIKILVNNGDTRRLRIAREISKMLEECGLVVEMIEANGNDYYYILSLMEYDLYVGQTKLSPNMDLSAFFMPNGSLRHGGMTDAAIYSMCLEALANDGNYINLHRMIADDGRLCPILFQTYSIHATRGLLTGLTPSRDNVFYYTLDKNMKDILFYPE